MSFDVEGFHTCGYCNTHSIAKEKSQAVNQVGLSSPSCSRDYHPERGWSLSFSMILHKSVGLQLLPLQVLGVSKGGKCVLSC